MTSNVIYKHTLEMTDFQTLDLPVDARILAVQMQDGKICLWTTQLRGEYAMNKTSRRFTIVGTGNAYDERNAGRYVGTVQQPPYVWHVFVNDYPAYDA